MKNVLALFFILLSISCFGQPTDSLSKIAFGNYPAQKRIRACTVLADSLSKINPTETIKIARAGLVIAVKLNDGKARGAFLKDMGRAWYLEAKYDSAGYFLGQAARAFEKIKDSHGLADTYHEYVKLYSRIKDYKNAIIYQQKLISYSQKNEPQRLTMVFLEQLGKLYEDDDNYKDALNSYKKSLDIRDSLNIAQKNKRQHIGILQPRFCGRCIWEYEAKGQFGRVIAKNHRD